MALPETELFIQISDGNDFRDFSVPVQTEGKRQLVKKLQFGEEYVGQIPIHVRSDGTIGFTDRGGFSRWQVQNQRFEPGEPLPEHISHFRRKARRKDGGYPTEIVLAPGGTFTMDVLTDRSRSEQETSNLDQMVTHIAIRRMYTAPVAG